MKTFFFIILLALIFLSIPVFAQKSESGEIKFQIELPSTTQEEQNFQFPDIEDFDGTYQFIVKTPKAFMLTTEIFELMEQHRKENEDEILYLSDDLEVYLYARSKISRPDFLPFKTPYIIQRKP